MQLPETSRSGLKAIHGEKEKATMGGTRTRESQPLIPFHWGVPKPKYELLKGFPKMMVNLFQCFML